MSGSRNLNFFIVFYLVVGLSLGASPTMYVTVYTTRYNTQYAIITRYWGVLPDGTYVLKSSETRYLTPEEYAEAVSEEERRRKAGRAQAPRGEGEGGVPTAVGVLT